LQQTKPVSERIGQHRDPPIRRIARCHLEDRTGGKCARDRCIDIVDDDVDMQRRPTVRPKAAV